MHASVTFSYRLFFFTVLFAEAISSEGFGQVKENVLPSTLGVQVTFNDFKHIDRAHSFSGLSNLKTGISVNYLQGINAASDIVATVAGSIIDFTSQKQVSYGQGNKSLLLETDVSVRHKFFSHRFIFPFVQVGAGVSVYKQYWGAFVPVGAGVQADISKRTFLLANAQYRLPLSITQDHHFFYSLGIAGVIGKSKQPKKAPGRIEALLRDTPKDTDGDGIVDSLDKCVTIPGVAAYSGCPVPDTDGDGITDDRDSCVTTPGVLKYNGCPVPDRDGDNVNDEVDECPDMPGVAAYKGCPVIEETVGEKMRAAAKKIFFVTGSYELKFSSYEVLDSVVQLLQQNDRIKIDIEGHTDNTGLEIANQLLSEKRAGAVKDYLISKGIQSLRLRSFGYGQRKPIADNTNDAGRAINRRVEIKIRKE